MKHNESKPFLSPPQNAASPLFKGPVIRRNIKIPYGDGDGNLAFGANVSQSQRAILQRISGRMLRYPEAESFTVMNAAAKLALARPMERA